MDWVDLKKQDISKTVVPGSNRFYLQRADVWRHKDFNHTTLENDLALVFLPDGMSDGLGIPALMPNRDAGLPGAPGDLLDVVGWGQTGIDEPYSNTPRSVTLGYISNEECGEGTTADQMCAASTTEEINGPCTGDLVRAVGT